MKLHTLLLDHDTRTTKFGARKFRKLEVNPLLAFTSRKLRFLNQNSSQSAQIVKKKSQLFDERKMSPVVVAVKNSIEENFQASFDYNFVKIKFFATLSPADRENSDP